MSRQSGPAATRGEKLNVRRLVGVIRRQVYVELEGAAAQGLTLVQVSAQLERFSWDRGWV